MTEQIQDQISAFADDELSAEECEFLVRRMERDPEFRRKAASYATIGAALRGEILSDDPDVLRRGVQTALSGVVPAPTRHGLKTAVPPARFVRPAMGFGIAATVAAVALLALTSLNQPADPPLLTAGDVSVVPTGERASYVVPQEASTYTPSGTRPLAVPIRMTNYLMTHGEYVPGFGRTSIHTNVVGNRGTLILVNTEPARE